MSAGGAFGSVDPLPPAALKPLSLSTRSPRLITVHPLLSVDFYSQNATALSERYRSVTFESVHAAWHHLLPPHSALILDVGAGSGRDAAWLAQHGHEVVALEPSPSLREIGRQQTPANVRWIDDSLPALTEVNRLALRFDVILVSAVWMHVAPGERDRALRKLSALLRPGGILVLTLRETPFDDGRSFHPTPPEELRSLAREHMLEVVLESQNTDSLRRQDIAWRTFVFRLPDDGTGALPLLRHIILNDAKSSTYKLALLRCMLRIADGYAGAATVQADGKVSVPLGLVALVWTRLFKRLLLDTGEPLPQQPPGNRGHGFVRAPFKALASISIHDLRAGQSFVGADAVALHGALRDAAATIAAMPANYITFPNSSESIFVARRGRTPNYITGPLDFLALNAFGEMLIPRSIWDALRTHACWIEPALVTEWARKIAIYRDGSPDRWHDPKILGALQWLDPEHRTAEVRDIAQAIRSSGHNLFCIWTGKILHADFDIDHCLPFAIWPNNDLWNLVPAHRPTNLKKRDRLVSAEKLIASSGQLQDWWDRAYIKRGHEQRFITEASASLPLVRERTLVPPMSRVFLGLEVQRMTLRRNQQLQEWPSA